MPSEPRPFTQANAQVNSIPSTVRASLGAQTVNDLPAMWETRVQSLGQEDPLKEEMATHSSILPGESHGQRSLVGHRVSKSQTRLND